MSEASSDHSSDEPLGESSGTSYQILIQTQNIPESTEGPRSINVSQACLPSVLFQW